MQDTNGPGRPGEPLSRARTAPWILSPGVATRRVESGVVTLISRRIADRPDTRHRKKSIFWSIDAIRPAEDRSLLKVEPRFQNQMRPERAVEIMKGARVGHCGRWPGGITRCLLAGAYVPSRLHQGTGLVASRPANGKVFRLFSVGLSGLA